MEEEQKAQEASERLKNLISQRKVDMARKKEGEEKEKMDQFLEEERKAEESSRRLRDLINKRKQEQDKKKDEDEKKKNG